MQNTNKRQSHEVTRVVNAISDEKVRYFYLMLGEAIAEHMARPIAASAAKTDGPVNTSAAHIAILAARLNAG